MTWKSRRAKELVSFRTGKLDSNAAEVDGKYPFFTCAQETYKINKHAFDTECVLLGGNNAAGIFPLKYYKGKFNAYQRTYIIEPKDRNQLNTRFLYNSFIPFLKQFEQSSTGVTTKFLTLGILNNLWISLPAFEVQEKIAAILSAYDDLITANNRRISLLEKMTEELYREWFVRMRFPGHEKVKIVNGIPDGWDVKQITEMYQTSSGGTPSREKPEYYNGSVPWIKTGELKNTFLIKTEELITEAALEKSSAKIFPKYTVVLAMYCAMGELSILSLDAATNQACCAFLPKHEYLSYPFSYQLIRNVRQSLINLSFGAAQQNLSQEIIKKFKVLVPKKELILKYSRFVLPVFQTAEIIYIQNDKLKSSRDRLLSRLMSGKIDVEKIDVEFPVSMKEDEVVAGA